MEELLSVELELKELKWKDLYQLTLNGTSKNGNPLLVKVKLERAKMEDLYSVS